MVLSRKDRDGGMAEIELSQDMIRWTVHVPATLADSPDAPATYQAMADAMTRTHGQLSAIVAANRSV